MSMEDWQKRGGAKPAVLCESCQDSGFIKAVAGGVAACSATDPDRIPCPADCPINQ